MPELRVGFDGQEGRVVHRPDNAHGFEWVVYPDNSNLPICYGLTRIDVLEVFYRRVQKYTEELTAYRQGKRSPFVS